MDRRLTALVACCLATTPLAAAVHGGAGDDIDDLRGYLGFPPAYDVDVGRGTATVGADLRLGVQLVRNFTPIDDRVGGWIWGAEASLTPFDQHGIDGVVFAATGLVGYAYRLPQVPNIHFEGTPFLGLGFADRSGGDHDGTHGYAEFGLRAAAFWTFESRWQAGFDLRFIRTRAGDMHSDGVMPSFVGGYRF